MKVEILEEDHVLISLGRRAPSRRTYLNERSDQVAVIRLPGLRYTVRFYWVARKGRDPLTIRPEKAG